MKTTQHTPFKCWLWPDRTIGKTESRMLREEHNALVNRNQWLQDNANELLEACKDALESLERCIDNPKLTGSPSYRVTCVQQLRAAIAKAEQGKEQGSMSKDPQWSWISERMPKGFRLVLNYGGLKLVSATLSDKAFENTWKHILLDRYHRIKDGKAFDGVTRLDDSTYLVAGLL